MTTIKQLAAAILELIIKITMKEHLSLIISLFSLMSFSQNYTTLKITSDADDHDLRNIMKFEDLYIDKIELQGDNIKGKNYVVYLKEFKNGKLIETSELFESSSIDYPVAESKLSFTLMSKMIDNQKLKIALKFDRFGSRTFFFNLYDNTKFGYVMKNFMGTASEKKISSDKEFYITSIISPTILANGGASYCQVVDKGDPEKLGENFNIPHYYLVSMKFIK